MKEKYEKKIPDMKWEVMDVKDMKFPDGSFDVIIDKACLDAICCGDNSVPNTTMMLKSVHRVLKHDGHYICVTYGFPEMRTHYFEQSENFDWKLAPTKKTTKQFIATKDIIAEGNKDVNEHFDFIYTMKRNGPEPPPEEDED